MTKPLRSTTEEAEEQAAPARPVLQSRRLTALEAALAAGDAGALDAFWQELAEQGAPLIEEIEGAPDRRLVTFVWRQPGPEPPENVIIFSAFLSLDFQKMRLQPLAGSDVWYISIPIRSDIRSPYAFGVNDSLLPYLEDPDFLARAKKWFPDPLNPHTFVSSPPSDDPDAWHRVEAVLELPDAPEMPWFARRSDVPAGVVEQHRFASEILGNERDLWLYTPPGYDPSGDPPGLLLLFDGDGARYILDVPGTLDRTLAEGAAPPLVALMVGQVDRNAELPPNEDWVRFLETELLPWLRERVTISADPAKSVVSGLSYGGLCATWCGLHLSHIFGNVLSQSGSFWWKPDPFDMMNPPIAGDAFEYEWLTAKYIAAPLLPLRFYLDVGKLENMLISGAPAHQHANRHMRDVLRLKGYDVHYSEYPGGHDFIWWRQTLADGLVALLGT